MGKHKRSNSDERRSSKKRKKHTSRQRSRSRSPSPSYTKTSHSSKSNKSHMNDHDSKPHLLKETYDEDCIGKQCLANTSSDTEKEMSFDWDNHRQELNKIFFNNNDIIKRGSEEYHDFWKFAKKYTSLQKGKLIQKVINENTGNIKQQETSTDKRSQISFKLNIPSTEVLMSRVPRDLDHKVSRLTYNKVEEFQYILLLYMDFIQKKRFEKLKKLRESQKNLPIAEFKSEIIDTVKNNSIVIIAGDTGCGKSTQVPQFLLSAGFTNIACTQPRRIACISLSKRVAHETLNEYGSEIGYQIRFEKKKTDHTKILFLTEGLLLRQVTTDTVLGQYNVIILDEIHERHLHTDFLLGVMKCLIMKRTDIKVILMSATINIDLFKSYFMNEAPVIQVPGRLYPIKLQYFPVPIIEQCSKSEKINPAPYIRVLQLIDSKYPSTERGDLLIFLSGMSEITTISEAAQAYAEQTQKWVILPLHSTLSVAEQEKVFHIPPTGVRKCILSTNIAETSITIDGVRFVIDSGKVKEMNFDSNTKMQKLKEFWVSKASAEQRKGRAGRTGPGVCFRLYSEEEYSFFNHYSAPEIQRVSLDTIILQMISMGLPSIKLFPFIEPPSPESLNTSLCSLKSHDALNNDDNLTSIGHLLAQLPMDVALGKMLIMGSLFHQVEPVLSLAAAMSVQSPFTNKAYRDPDATALNKELESDHGDPFTLLNSFKEWLAVKMENRESSRRWCRKRGLEEQRFYEMVKLRSQFSQLLVDSGLCNIGGDKRKAPLTSAERAKRHGELKQLLDLKKQLNSKEPKKAQVLKVDYHALGNTAGSDDEDIDLKDVDFKITNDRKMLCKLHDGSLVQSFKDVILLKIILCCGLYPNVAVADDHNNYKPGSEQVFHTKSKPFVILHPNSVFSSHPEVLELSDADIIDLPNFSRRNPVSERHQILTYVSLLETNKPYLVNSFRVPAAQMLLLFASNIDTNSDFSVLVCDEFIELKFPDAVAAQNLVFKIVQLRTKWSNLLQYRINAAKPDIEDSSEFNHSANILEKELTTGFIDLCMSEIMYSMTRLLAADVKILHTGPGPHDLIMSSNPFAEKDEDSTCLYNDIKGGVDLTHYLTYNCLFDTNSTVTTITSYDCVCPYCDEEMHCTVMECLVHMSNCIVKGRENSTEMAGDYGTGNANKKKYFCKDCDKELFLSIKDIFAHKKRHKIELSATDRVSD